MYRNPYIAKERELERRLARLERMYDRDGEPQREYAKALHDINELYTEKKIDYDHACYLAEGAEQVLNEKLERLRAKRAEAKFEAGVEAKSGCVGVALLLLALSVIALVAML